MSVTCLTAGVCDELQQAIEHGIDVQRFVRGFSSATLPGLIEYGCARRQYPGLPTLPELIVKSELGRANAKVLSELGIRSSGARQRPFQSITAQSNEFFVLEGQKPTLRRDWIEFRLRFEQSAKASGFPLKTATALAAAFGEMADNAVNHSNSSIGILVGYQALPGMSLFCIADAGIGVLESLRSNPEYCNLNDHREAIRLALKPGVSRYGRGHGGSGFAQVFKSLAQHWGTLRFRSGKGCVTIDGRECNADVGVKSETPLRPGFQVSVCCRTAESPQSEFLI
jgi:anti-sigma regulatory factor (Ser/Thr protein kinase)